jgi:hypothetical protein
MVKRPFVAPLVLMRASASWRTFPCFPAQHDDFEAIIVIQIHMQRGNDVSLMPMLQFRKLFAQQDAQSTALCSFPLLLIPAQPTAALSEPRFQRLIPAFRWLENNPQSSCR